MYVITSIPATQLYWYQFHGCAWLKAHPLHTSHICPDCLRLTLRII